MDSSATELRKPRQDRKSLTLAAILTAVAAVGCIGWLMRESWVLNLPTWVLLQFGIAEDAEIRAELRRRLEAGEVSHESAKEIVLQLGGEITVDFRTPFARNAEQFITVSHSTSLRDDRWKVELKDVSLEVDGATVIDTSIPQSIADLHGARHENILRVPGLEPGEHRLTVRANMVITDRSEGNRLFGGVRRPLALERILKVEGEVSDYLTLESTDEQCVDVARALVAFTVCRNAKNRPTHTLVIYESILSQQLIAEVSVRPKGAAEFTKVGTFLSRYAAGLTLASSHEYKLDEVDGIGKAERFDVRITPYPQLALHLRHRNCFGGLIEWVNLSIHRPWRGMETPTKTRPSPPTSVFPRGSDRAKP